MDSKNCELSKSKTQMKYLVSEELHELNQIIFPEISNESAPSHFCNVPAFDILSNIFTSHSSPSSIPYIDSPDNGTKAVPLKTKLRKWDIKNNVSHNECTGLLKTLKEDSGSSIGLTEIATPTMSHRTPLGKKSTRTPVISMKTDQIELQINKIRTDIEEIKKNQEVIKRQNSKNNLLLKSICDCLIPKAVKTNLPLPLKSPEDAIAFNEALNNMDKKFEFKNYINTVKGYNNKISSFICKIFDEKMLTIYNFDGMKGKLSFKDLFNISDCLFESVVTTDYGQCEFQTELKMVFRRAKCKLNNINWKARIKDKSEIKLF